MNREIQTFRDLFGYPKIIDANDEAVEEKGAA